MTQDIQNFIQYLHQEKNTSENTEVSYARDLKKMNQYLLTQGICDVNDPMSSIWKRKEESLRRSREVLRP